MEFQTRVDQENEKLKINKTYVTIVIKNNKLWLRGTLPVKPWLNKNCPDWYQQFISLGRNATLTETGLKYSLQRVKIINGQLEGNKFDWLDWVKKPSKSDGNNLLKIFIKYLEAKRNSYSPNSIKMYLMSIQKFLATLDSCNIEDALKIKQELMKNKSPQMAKKYLSELSRCCNWAIENKLIDSNPFKDLISTIKIKKDITDINPFTRQERDLIIENFKSDKQFKYCAFLVQFLFFTGCRPSEALALQYKHINLSQGYISFEQILCRDKTIKNSLKTQKKRRFPINSQLANILKINLDQGKSKDDFVFTNKMNENLVDFADFQYRIWKNGIMKKLLESGQIAEYRKPYQTRHTFITLCLESGIDAKDVANWVGNSAEIIYKHYAGFNQDLKVPEL